MQCGLTAASVSLNNVLTVFTRQARRWTGCSATGAAISGSTCTASDCPSTPWGRTTTTCAGRVTSADPPTPAGDATERWMGDMQPSLVVLVYVN